MFYEKGDSEIKPTFEKGDVVQLKSGGPKMTVAWCGSQLGTPLTMCQWFIQDKAPWKVEEKGFPPTSLKKVEAS